MGQFPTYTPVELDGLPDEDCFGDRVTISGWLVESRRKEVAFIFVCRRCNHWHGGKLFNWDSGRCRLRWEKGHKRPKPPKLTPQPLLSAPLAPVSGMWRIEAGALVGLLSYEGTVV